MPSAICPKCLVQVTWSKGDKRPKPLHKNCPGRQKQKASYPETGRPNFQDSNFTAKAEFNVIPEAKNPDAKPATEESKS